MQAGKEFTDLFHALKAFLEIGLKVSTLPVVALGVGIGVEYGIYICGRLLAYMREGGSTPPSRRWTSRNTEFLS